jgi:hypothetical protein
MMQEIDVEIAALTPSPTRPVADPVKLQRMGSFDWDHSIPIIVEKVGDRLVIQDGMTRVEAARRAGIVKLPAYVFAEQ